MKTFGSEHCVYLGMAVGLSVIYALPHKRRWNPKTRKLMTWSLFWILIVNETWWAAYRNFALGVPISKNLPLHMCDFAIFVTLGAIAFRKKVLFEMTYYVSLAAGLLAVVYPNISETGNIEKLSHLRYFITHICIWLSGIYFTVGSGFYPNYASVVRCLAIVHAYGFLVAIPNYFLDTNYFYVFRRPSNPDFLPDITFPWYQIGFSGVYVIVLNLMHVPMAIRNQLFAKHH